MLKLKLQYFGHLKQMSKQWVHLTHWKKSWCWERLKAGREGGDRGWDSWIASLTQWTWIWTNWETVKNREAWCAARSLWGCKESDTTWQLNNNNIPSLEKYLVMGIFQSGCFLVAELQEFLMYSGYEPLIRCMIWKYVWMILKQKRNIFVPCARS